MKHQSNINMKRPTRPLFRVCALTLSLSLSAACLPFQAARAQSGIQSVVGASSLKELPLKAWGMYARTHVGPACAVDQILGQQFVFPLVIAQERQAVMPAPTLGADGKTAPRLRPVILMRRALGLSPTQGWADDQAPSGAHAARNRVAQVVDANGEGLLWTYRVHFAPAQVSQANVTLRPAAADIAPAVAANAESGEAWGAGEATIDCFPAFADPDGDGLLLRVSITNASTTEQTYCVDLLGGMDTPNPAFDGAGFHVQAAPDQSGVTLGHLKSQAVFALAAPGPPFRARSYRVSGAYFDPGSVVARLNVVGTTLPGGLLAPSTPNLPDDAFAGSSDNASEKTGDTKKTRPARPPRKGKADEANNPAANAFPSLAKEPPGEAQYALCRVDSVTVAPGQTTTFFLSVGVGRSGELARASAQSLLGAAGETNGTTGAYAAALKAHDAARFKSGQPALDRLMAQTLANTPNMAARRIGVGTRSLREENRGRLYDPARDALMALGWINYRPDFAAAQLNAWFQTKKDPDPDEIAAANVRAVPPTNLFALWELYERVHDRALLARYYPYVRRRYLELLAAGRVKDDEWRFAWPASASDPIFVPGSVLPLVAQPVRKDAAGAAQRIPRADIAAPDYAGYVIRAARIMQTLSELNGEDAAVTRRFGLDAVETARVLNTVNWDVEHKTYVPVAASPDAALPVRTDTLAGLLPLIAGADALPPTQRAGLLQSLTDPEQFWTPDGLRSVSLHSRLYHPDDGANGAIRYGLNWLFWKALLDLGETDTARKLADNLLSGYVRAQAASDACPEWLNPDTGAGGGAADYAGDAGALLAMQTAYHLPGTFTGGWNAHFLDSGYNAMKDTLHLVARRLQSVGKVSVICVMGKPGGKYALSGAMTGTQTADASGGLTLTLPADNTTLVIDIAPAG